MNELLLSPELRINVLHVPAERFAVQFPPQGQTLRDAAGNRKEP